MGDLIVGIVIGGFIFGFVAQDLATNATDKQIEECQKDLPRSQKCVLIAIPEKQENK